MTEEQAFVYKRIVDRALSMLDLPDYKYLWAAKEQVDGEWVVVVREGEEE